MRRKAKEDDATWCKVYPGDVVELLDTRDAAIAQLREDNKKLRGEMTDALHEAAKVLWFDDNSDFGTSLWKVVELLGGEEKVKLLEDGDDKAIEKWLWPDESANHLEEKTVNPRAYLDIYEEDDPRRPQVGDLYRIESVSDYVDPVHGLCHPCDVRRTE